MAELLAADGRRALCRRGRAGTVATSSAPSAASDGRTRALMGAPLLRIAGQAIAGRVPAVRVIGVSTGVLKAGAEPPRRLGTGVSIRGMARESESGLPIEPVYGPEALDGWDPEERLGEPGAYPYTRGVYPSMYTGRPWTMRQYAGFGTATESNERYHRLVEAGTGGLSVAFDLPTQMGMDSDDPRGLAARSARSGSRSTRSRTCARSSTASRWARCRRR